MNTQDSQSSHWHYGDLDDSNFQVHGRTLLLLLILFCLIIFFTLFFFYIRWVLRYRRRNNVSIPTTAVSGDAAANVPANASVGLDRIVIDNLPISLHRTMDEDGDDDDEPQCSICLTVFEDQEKVKILPLCNHNYHPECVDKWLTAHSSCPLCRASLRVDTLVVA